MSAWDVRLSDGEREAVLAWSDGSYSCACLGPCPVLPCYNDANDIVMTVERIIAVREREAAARAWTEGYYAAVKDHGKRDRDRTPNPYRADRIAP